VNWKENQMEVDKAKLENLLEPFIFTGLSKSRYEVSLMPAERLLTWNRLDLGFKLFYLDTYFKNRALALNVYKEDIRCQTLGKFQEIGNSNKNSFERYVVEFNKVYENLQKNGFSQEKSIVPLSRTLSLINGAHRVASAIHLKQVVNCIHLEEKEMVCNYRYFLDRNVSEDIVEIAVNTFLSYSNNSYLAFLWPSGKETFKKSFSQFSNIIYEKDITLTHQGAFNLLVELYKHMDWVGPREKGYPQIHKKKLECFPTLDTFKVVAFQANSIDEVLYIKKAIRDINKIGFSSIHITDTTEEAIRISRLIFNANGVHFLNFGNPFKFASILDKIDRIKSFAVAKNIERSDLVLDSGCVLELYGLRKSSDIDCFINGVAELKYEALQLDTHDSELVYHEKSKEELIYNPLFYFYYQGLKFISFSQIYHLKGRRGGKKDLIDLEMMKSLVGDDRKRMLISRFKQSLFYFQIRIFYGLLNPILALLRKIGIYNQVRGIYRKIKNF
jgi:hypothetical protein